MERKEFEMTQSDLDKIIDACKSVPYMIGIICVIIGVLMHQAPNHAIDAVQKAVPVAQRVQSTPKLSFDDYKKFISQNEGVRNKVYLDSIGIPTIGVGFNLRRPDAKKLLSSLGYDYDMILAGTSQLRDEDVWGLFRGDLQGAISGAGMLVSNFDKLPNHVKLVIVDMVFNLGFSKFSKFRKAIDAFERMDFGTAADEMTKSKWYHQVGNRSKRNVGIVRGGCLR